MKATQAIVSALKYRSRARLIGSAWFHHDAYWEVGSEDEKRHHLEQAARAVAMFSRTHGGSRADQALFTEGRGPHEPDAGMRELEIRLYECASMLKMNRPFIVRHIPSLLLSGVFLVAAAIWCFSLLLLLCSNRGLAVSYFRGKNFDTKVMGWTERRALKLYEDERPCLLCPRQNYSARWEGVLVAPKTDNYSFETNSRGGLRLLIDDDLTIDHWEEHDWTPGKQANRELTKGKHRIRIDYYNTRGNGALRVRWCGGGIPPHTILGEEYLRKR